MQNAGKRYPAQHSGGSPFVALIMLLAQILLLSMAPAAQAQTHWEAFRLDERLAMPRNYVAADGGTWGATTQLEYLNIANDYGLHGNYYESCTGFEQWHPQHAIRLRNEDGRAYFAVAQSKKNGGWISVIETYEGMLDANDRVKSTGFTGAPVNSGSELGLISAR